MKDAFDDVIMNKIKKEPFSLPHSYEEKVRSVLKNLPWDEEKECVSEPKWRFRRYLKPAFGIACVLCLIALAVFVFGREETRPGENGSSEQLAEGGKARLEQYATEKEETKTQEYENSEEPQLPRPTVGGVTMAYDGWVSPVRDVYHLSLGIKNVNDQELYFAAFAGTEGDDVFAVSDGIIEECGFTHYAGNYVVLAADNGAKVQFWHLSEMMVKEGDEIKKGTVIASMGKTGMVTGPAVTIVVTMNGESIKPVISEEEYQKPAALENGE